MGKNDSTLAWPGLYILGADLAVIKMISEAFAN